VREAAARNYDKVFHDRAQQLARAPRQEHLVEA
jgi:hypothetical protein